MEAGASFFDSAEPIQPFDPIILAGDPTWRQFVIPDARAVRAPRGEPDDLVWAGAADIARWHAAGRIDTAAVIRAFLDHAAAAPSVINAFVTETLAHADLAGEPDGRLAGVPVGLKDAIDAARVPSMCSSPVFKDRIPDEDAPAWGRLRKAGALLAGKTGMPQFSGAMSTNEFNGPVVNPWTLQHDSGGSSSGSGAAVAAGLCTIALGTDTGGSVRIPAACCGVVGFKPTFGTVSTDGVFPMSPSLDQVGPIARSVRDCALAVDLMTGSQLERAALSGEGADLRGLRVGVPRSWLPVLQPAVSAAFEEALSQLEELGAEVFDVDLPEMEGLIEVNRTFAHGEQARIHDPLRMLPGYSDGLRKYTDRGRPVTVARYRTAQRERIELTRRAGEVWRQADVLAWPTLAYTAPPVGATEVVVGDTRYPAATQMVYMNAALNVTGWPAISVPCGFDHQGLPIGLQVTAPPARDDLVCFVAAAYEGATEHHTVRPPWAR
ncbi:amidase [Sinosporangium album]|uniref:amidase n=1 Tax=Sinosporangium album TaxID=504805 RepID=UPI0015A16C8D|nr:amidase [Sinosporangium album]